ncbi:MAG: hypothetical protein ACXABY_14565 [Candidatus Thorarchaeota archaeon]|jgi:hypothetical protein
MNFTKIATIYSFIIGIAMIAMWTIFLLTGQVPELQTEPARIIMHLAAEFTTAFVLIIGGYGLLTNRTWGVRFHQFSLGMLMYTLIVSPGYYLQLGDIAMVGMFGTMFLLTLIVLILTFVKANNE